MKSYYPYMIREKTSTAQTKPSNNKKSRDKKTVFRRLVKNKNTKAKKSKVDKSSTFIEMQTFSCSQNDTTTSFYTRPTSQKQKDTKKKRKTRFKCGCFG